MKGQFPQFDPGATVDYKAIWETSLFVFDTNVLLNLYRYQAATRDQLLDVLDKLADRIWIPHHVGLEFQRNRFSVLADQNKRFSEVKSVVSKAKDALRNDLQKLQLERRHSLIDPAPLVDGFDKLADDFLSSLESIQKDQQKLTAPDPLKDKIETLFSGRVGPAVSDQDEVNVIYTRAEKRYQLEIPPGYLDSKKDDEGPVEYVHDGIHYKRKYGDYLIWHQLLTYAKEQQVKSVVFVTDDAKNDWWWIVKSEGPKTLGPRPELREEASRLGEISQFNMYKPEGFLTYSKDYLEADVSSEAIREVRDVSMVRNHKARKIRELTNRAEMVEEAVYGWLIKQYDSVVRQFDRYPDIVVKQGGMIFGYEVKLVSDLRSSTNRYREFIRQALLEIEKESLDTLTIVIAIEGEPDTIAVWNSVVLSMKNKLTNSISVVLGVIQENSTGAFDFTPWLKASADELEIM